MRTLLAGNWKMNGLRASLAEIRALKRSIANSRPPVDILICPPATLIAEAAKTVEDAPIDIGAQDCDAEISRADLRRGRHGLSVTSGRRTGAV